MTVMLNTEHDYKYWESEYRMFMHSKGHHTVTKLNHYVECPCCGAYINKGERIDYKYMYGYVKMFCSSCWDEIEKVHVTNYIPRPVIYFNNMGHGVRR